MWHPQSPTTLSDPPVLISPRSRVRPTSPTPPPDDLSEPEVHRYYILLQTNQEGPNQTIQPSVRKAPSLVTLYSTKPEPE
jgi:hypothetical protein